MYFRSIEVLACALLSFLLSFVLLCFIKSDVLLQRDPVILVSVLSILGIKITYPSVDFSSLSSFTRTVKLVNLSNYLMIWFQHSTTKNRTSVTLHRRRKRGIPLQRSTPNRTSVLVSTALCNQPEAFARDFGDDQTRYLLEKMFLLRMDE